MQAFGVQTEGSLKGQGKVICYDRGYKYLKSALLRWGFEVLSTEQRSKDFPFVYECDPKQLGGRRLVSKKGAAYAQTATRIEQHGQRKVHMLAMAWRCNGQVTLIETSIPELVAHPNQFTVVTKSRGKSVLEQARRANADESDTSSDSDGESTDDFDEQENPDDPDDEKHFFPGIQVVPPQFSSDDDDDEVTPDARGQRKRVAAEQPPAPDDDFRSRVTALHARVRAEHATTSPSKVDKHIATLEGLCERYEGDGWLENIASDMGTVTALTTAQTTPAWFAMRVGVFTSSVSHAIMNKTLPLLRCSDDGQVACSARIIGAFIDKALDEKVALDDFEYKTDDELDGLKRKALGLYIDQLNVARIQMGLGRITKSKAGEKKKETIARVKTDQREMQTKRDNDADGADLKAHIQTSLIKTWFMKRVDDKKCPSLTIGRNNEQYILDFVGRFLYTHSKRWMMLDQREVGLVENKDKKYICTSTDAVAWLADLEDADGDVYMVPCEFKTVTTTETIGQAKKVRSIAGKFSHCAANSKGTHVSLLFVT